MKINFLLRLQNKATLIALIAAVINILVSFGFKLPENISTIVDNVISILLLLGVIVDPTTRGIGDSDRAMLYDEPDY